MPRAHGTLVSASAHSMGSLECHVHSPTHPSVFPPHSHIHSPNSPPLTQLSSHNDQMPSDPRHAAMNTG